jgi:hypothetical protein
MGLLVHNNCNPHSNAATTNEHINIGEIIMNSKQLFWCRVFLITTTLLIIGAYINGFRFSRTVFVDEHRIAATLTMLAGFCCAQGIRKSAKNLFDTSNKLWFASFTGFVYTSFILFLLTTMFLMLSTTFIDPLEKKTLYPDQMMFLLPASTILWLLCMAAPESRSISWKFRLPKYPSFPKDFRPQERTLKKTKNTLYNGTGSLKQKFNTLTKGLRK